MTAITDRIRKLRRLQAAQTTLCQVRTAQFNAAEQRLLDAQSRERAILHALNTGMIHPAMAEQAVRSLAILVRDIPRLTAEKAAASNARLKASQKLKTCENLLRAEMLRAAQNAEKAMLMEQIDLHTSRRSGTSFWQD